MNDRPAGDGNDQQDDARNEPQHELSSFLGLAARATYTRREKQQSRWAVPGSNQRPPACKAGALPTELTALGALDYGVPRALVRPRRPARAPRDRCYRPPAM